MKNNKQKAIILVLFFIISTLYFSNSTSALVDSNDRKNQQVIRSRPSTPIGLDTQPWYRENLGVNIGPEGDIYGWARMEGYPLNFGSITPDQFVDSASLFLWGGFRTNQNTNPYSDNTWLDLHFATNDPTVAEAIGWQFISLLNSQAPFTMTFRESRGYDDYVNGQWTQITQVSFEGRVDWINMIDVVDASIPRANGGIAESINVTTASSLNYWFWIQSDNTVGLSVGVDFHERYTTQVGGHSLNLNELFHVTEIKKSTIADRDLAIDFWLPDVTNQLLVPSNTTDTTMNWYYHPSAESQNLHNAWSGTFILSGPVSFGVASANPIILTFDYSFFQWSWKNRDSLWWEVDQRGFDHVAIESWGKGRTRLTPNLGADSTLVADVVNFNLNFVDNNYFSLSINFAGNGNRVTEYKAIASEINASLGIDFLKSNTSYNFDENAYQWNWRNGTSMPVSSVWVLMDPTTINYEKFVLSTYGFNKSAILVNSSIANLPNFSFNMNYDWFGLGASIRMDYSVANDNDLPGKSLPNAFNSSATHFVDFTNPNYLGWTQGIPWNNYTETIEINFNTPFDGDWELGTTFYPSTNNGWKWDSGRGWNNNDGTDYLYYNFRIHSNNPLLTDQAGNIISSQRISDWNATWNYNYKTYMDDIDSPWINTAQFRNYTVADNGDFYDTSPWPLFDSSASYNGTLDVITRIQDYSDGGRYWDATAGLLLPKFPNSGIQAANISLFRPDAPVDHPSFKFNYPMTYNSTINPDGTEEAWQTSIDTTLLADGEWEFWGEVTDNAGNSGQNYMNVMTIDNYQGTTASTINLDDAPADLAHVSDIVYFNFSVVDDVGAFAVIFWVGLGGWVLDPVSTSVDASGNVVQNYSFMLDTIFQEENRELTIKIEVLDMDGFWTDLITHVVIDNIPLGTAPTITVVDVPAAGTKFNATIDPKIDFKVNVTEDFKIAYVRLYVGPSILDMALNDTTGSYEITIDISAWSPGNYSWYVEAKDLDENTHTVQTAASVFEIEGAPIVTDTGPPVITILSHSDGDEVNGTIEIRIEVTDDLGVQSVVLGLPDGSDEVLKESSTAGVYTYSLDTTGFADGEYSIDIRATDQAAKSTTVTLSLIFNNGRTASAPELGLPGFELFIALFAVFSMITIVRRRT